MHHPVNTNVFGVVDSGGPSFPLCFAVEGITSLSVLGEADAHAAVQKYVGLIHKLEHVGLPPRSKRNTVSQNVHRGLLVSLRVHTAELKIFNFCTGII